MDQNRKPLLSALDAFLSREPAYFCIPGHRFERGMPGPLAERLGTELYRYDLTEAEGLDDYHAPAGVIREAEELAADLFGADACRFTVNGTTAAVEAMILAAAGPGEEIILARNVHRSALSGLILSGAKPVWLMPDHDPEWGIAKGIDPEAVRETIRRHPAARAVLIVSPTYYGVVSDIAAIADVCHEAGIPLLVDAAHGAHLGFCEGLPPSVVRSGADLTAVSLHKTAGAMTQSSMLFYRAEHTETIQTDPETGEAKKTGQVRHYADWSALCAAFKMTVSSSPSYVLMASLDAARWQLALDGEVLARQALDLALDLRRALEEIPGINVLGGSDPEQILLSGLDPTRVVFHAEGISGTDLKNRLFAEGQVALEMADLRNVVAVVTAANTGQEILQLGMAVWGVAGKGAEQDVPLPGITPVLPEMALLPRDAWFAKKEETDLENAAGRISAEGICPYPPGIPVINPGEVLSEEVIAQLIRCAKQKIPLQGTDDIRRIRVVAEE